MAQIRHEINILDHSISGVAADVTSNEIVQLDTTQYNGTLTCYFEIVGSKTTGDVSTVSLRRSGTSTDDASISAADMSTTTGLVRSASFTPPAGATSYRVFVDYTSGNAVFIKSARIVIIQNATTLTNTETQIEIGTYQTARTNETAQALQAPKYWKYTAANWDGTKTFYAEAVYDSGDMDTITVALETSASITAPSWSTAVTIVSAATTTTPTRTRVAFTPTDGNWYRITSLNGSMDNHDIYRAGVVVRQNYFTSNLSIGSASGLTTRFSIQGDGGTNERVGQSFLTDSNTWQVTEVHAWMIKTGAPTDNVYCNIRSGSMTGTILGTSGNYAVSALATGASTDVTFSFASPVTLTASTTHYLEWVRTGARDTTNYAQIWQSGGGNDYANGSAQVSDSGSWSASANDLYLTSQAVKYQYFTGTVTKLEPQYLLANALLGSGTSLQTFLTKWDSTEWSGVTNTYYSQAEASNDSTSDVTIEQADGGGTVTNSTLTNVDNAQISAALTMPSSENLDTKATTNNLDIAAVRILVATVVDQGTVTSQTITGVSRISKNVSQTITGKAAIQKDATQTITGKARINNTNSQTETGVSRISKNVAQTFTGKAAIQKDTTQTETGVARISKTVGQTITGKANIIIATDQTITGTARISKNVSQTISGKATIQKTTSQTESGTARISKSVAQTESGTARISKSVSQTETGTARVSKTVSQTETGASRISKTVAQTNTGTARISKTAAQTITGKGLVDTQERYWIGGTGNWSDTANWAYTSGGSGGAPVPTTSDDVFIDSNSGFGSGGTISETGTVVCRNFTANSGHNYTISYVDSDISIYGSAVFEAGLTWDTLAYTQFRGSTVGATITPNSCVFSYVSLYGTGDWTLMGNMTVTDVSHTGGYFEFQSGTFDANGYNVTADVFAISAGIGYSPTLVMGSGTFEGTYVGAQTFWSVTESGGGVVTITPETSTVKYAGTANDNMTFAGGGKTYNNLLFARGGSTGTNFVYGSNTFKDLSDTGTAAHSLKFEAGTTNHFTTFDVSGSSGNVISINSHNTSTHALVKDGGGTISCDYLNIQHSVATPANTWYAGANSVDNQSTPTAGSGWIFTAPPDTTQTITGTARITATTTKTITGQSRISVSPTRTETGTSRISVNTARTITGTANIAASATSSQTLTGTARITATTARTITGTARIGGGGRLKYWNGSSWTLKTLNHWTGSAWVEKTLKYWDGSSWQS